MHVGFCPLQFSDAKQVLDEEPDRVYLGLHLKVALVPTGYL